MKLSQIVRYLNVLEDSESVDAELLCKTNLGDWVRKAQTAESVAVHHIAQLQNSYNDVRQSVEKFANDLESIKQELRSMVADMQSAYFKDSYLLYYRSVNATDEYLLDQTLALSQSTENFVAGRVMKHSNWRHAGIVIRPGRGHWLTHMVGCDPLYLCDLRMSLMQSCVEQFPIEYRRRVRSYLLREYKPQDDCILVGLPEEQFGFVLAMDFFQYRPFELLRMYLADIYAKLKPGGVLAMTFNDCDRAAGVELTERNYMCYTPGSMVTSLAKSLGFELSQFYRLDAANVWMELRKPGELTSIRGGQSLAKIVANF